MVIVRDEKSKLGREYYKIVIIIRTIIIICKLEKVSLLLKNCSNELIIMSHIVRLQLSPIPV